MRLQGLRAQLGLWHAGLMALTLLSLAGFTYVLLIRVLHSRADAALLEHADTTAREIAILLARRQGGPLPSGEAPSSRLSVATPRFLANDLRSWGRYVQVVDPGGNVREKSDGLHTHPLPVHADALRRGLRGETTLETVPDLGEHPVRIVTVPVQLGTQIPFLVQAGTSLEGVEAALQRAGWILLILTPTVFLVALLGGWLLVGRALQRVDDLTRTALDIQGSNLQRRVYHGGADDEIGRLARAFDQMIARLDRSFQQVRQFSADASHELKTPLTAIRGEAEVALMGDLRPAETRRALAAILESAERMSEVVESLLLLARADAGQALIRREPVELGDLLLSTIESLESLAERSGVTLTVGAVEDLTVAGDALWLNQVVTNLISNGLKYTPAGGQVTVDLQRAGEPGEGAASGPGAAGTGTGPEPGVAGPRPRARLSVRDTGIGIPPEHLPHIFDRFYRVDHGRARVAGGAGLGLSITRWAVEVHGGTIEAESEVGKGTVFRVFLPLA
jgi:signal transduction histidine kinase